MPDLIEFVHTHKILVRRATLYQSHCHGIKIGKSESKKKNFRLQSNLFKFRNMNLILSVVAVLAILSPSRFVVPPIFASEIDQSENKHQQSIKSAGDELAVVEEERASLPAINHDGDQKWSGDVDGNEDEESQSVEGPKTTLQTDLFEFIDLVPADEVNELKVRYYVSDPKVRQAFDYLKNYNYSFVRQDLYELDEVQRAMLFFEKHEVNLNEVGDAMYDRFGPPNASFTHSEGE